MPIYKGKGDNMVCRNYRGISLLSVVGKIYGRVLVAKVKELTREWGRNREVLEKVGDVWIRCLH